MMEHKGQTLADRTRIKVLIVILILVALTTGGGAVSVLYKAAMEEARNRLQETAQSQAKLLEAIARTHTATDQAGRSSQTPQHMALQAIRDAHARSRGFGKTGEFTLAKLNKGQINFLLSHRHHDLDAPKPVSMEAEIAAPMRAALRGHSGTMVGLDYRGADVLAAFEPVAHLDWGIVAKVDLAEIRAPFIRASGIAFGIACLMMTLGVIAFLRLTNPILRRIRMREQQFHAVAHSATETILMTDCNGKVLFANPATKALFGYPPEQMMGMNVNQLIPEPFVQSHNKAMATFRTLGSAELKSDLIGHTREVTGLRATTEEFPAEISISTWTIGEKRYFSAIVRDISERKRMEARLKHQAEFDELTGLPNRTLFQDRLAQNIGMTGRTKKQLGLMFIDLDGFKQVNDTMGHDMGDLLLQEAAQRISTCVRRSDTVARLGGDEFTIILPNVAEGAYLESVARKILVQLNTPFVLGERTAGISGSIGITLYPEDADTMEALLKNADTAMYQAKAAGRNGFQFFTREVQARAVQRAVLEKEVHEALELGQFELFYQPRIAIPDGGVVGVEALLRWHHPKEGLLMPDRFMPIVEETGMIISVGEMVLRQACEAAQGWRLMGHPIQMSVNLSGAQLHRAGYLDLLIGDLLEQSGLPPELLCLEIPERLLTSPQSANAETLAALRNMGVNITLDDYGHGKMALSTLRRHPVNGLNVERAVVNNIENTQEIQDFVTTISSITSSMDLGLIATGAETEAQVTALTDANCPQIQGYFFSPPLPREVITMLLQEESDHAPMAMRLAQVA
ncbi:MAG: EAL domain-containing protein [Magnetococcales bacterium]|nr:EAL domain-containing protein [Magnetococcales bacterium]